MSENTEPIIYRCLDLANGTGYTVTGHYIDDELVRLEQTLPQRFNAYIEEHMPEVPWRVDAKYFNAKDVRTKYEKQRKQMAEELQRWLEQ